MTLFLHFLIANKRITYSSIHETRGRKEVKFEGIQFFLNINVTTYP